MKVRKGILVKEKDGERKLQLKNFFWCRKEDVTNDWKVVLNRTFIQEWKTGKIECFPPFGSSSSLFTSQFGFAFHSFLSFQWTSSIQLSFPSILSFYSFSLSILSFFYPRSAESLLCYLPTFELSNPCYILIKKKWKEFLWKESTKGWRNRIQCVIMMYLIAQFFPSSSRGRRCVMQDDEDDKIVLIVTTVLS